MWRCSVRPGIWALLTLGVTGLVLPDGAIGQGMSPSARGTLLGAGAGIALGIGLASVTDYPLEEGGAAAVVWGGGLLGAIHGRKLAASWSEPWQEPGRLHVSLSWGRAWTESSDDVQRAMAAAGFSGRDSHHAFVPSLTVTWDAVGPFRVGGELSGVKGVAVRAVNRFGWISESVEGRVASAILGASIGPTEAARMSYSVGAGLDHYSVKALAYVDQDVGSGLPSDVLQPERSSASEAGRWGVHTRLSVERYLTHDVSVQLLMLRRWTEGLDVPAVGLEDGSGQRVLEYPGHRLDIATWRVDFGFGLRY